MTPNPDPNGLVRLPCDCPLAVSSQQIFAPSPARFQAEPPYLPTARGAMARCPWRNLAQARAIAQRDRRRPQLTEELCRLCFAKLGDVLNRPELGAHQVFGQYCRTTNAGVLKGVLDACQQPCACRRPGGSNGPAGDCREGVGGVAQMCEPHHHIAVLNWAAPGTGKDTCIANCTIRTSGRGPDLFETCPSYSCITCKFTTPCIHSNM
jgi:hypothetical protein